MVEIIIFVLFLACIGALFGGGKSFGDSVRKGCGCLAMLLLVALIIMLLGLL